MKEILDRISSGENIHSVATLKELIDYIRPGKAKRPGEAVEKLQKLIVLLNCDPGLRKTLARQISDILGQYDPRYILSESGILSNRGFVSDFWSKTKHKFLPEHLEEKEIQTLINKLFHCTDDFVWLDAVPREMWVEILELLRVHDMFNNNRSAYRSLVRAIQSLSHNIAVLGLDAAITRKVPHLSELDSPFLVQNKELTLFIQQFKTLEFTILENEKFNHLISLLEECIDNINELYLKKNSFGISLHLTWITRRLLQKIDRLKLLLFLFHERDRESFYNNLIHLVRMLIRSENQRSSLSKLVKDNLDLVAFEIVEHSARKGGKYIADNAKEYWSYLKAAMLGGTLIALFATFKIAADSLTLSPLGQGLVFSLNYALCFVVVFILGGIIATKQPAMTASAVARSLNEYNEGSKKNLNGLKEMIIKVSRSQFISFVGNLIGAFPIAFLIGMGYQLVINSPFISDYKASALVQEVHPFESGALFYASIAGIFLALSGLISGYFDNKVIYSRIPQRLQAHPKLIRWMSSKRLKQLSDYIENNLGALAGNIALGFLLGMAGTFGYISGLPFDIRHIAFSSANVGFAFENGSLPLNYATIIFAVLGIVGIGLINFLVSFGLTLSLALKSRKITFKQTRELTRMLQKHFFQSPLDFFLYRTKI